MFFNHKRSDFFEWLNMELGPSTQICSVFIYFNRRNLNTKHEFWTVVFSFRVWKMLSKKNRSEVLTGWMVDWFWCQSNMSAHVFAGFIIFSKALTGSTSLLWCLRACFSGGQYTWAGCAHLSRFAPVESLPAVLDSASPKLKFHPSVMWLCISKTCAMPRVSLKSSLVRLFKQYYHTIRAISCGHLIGDVKIW